ncbi:hypothetical protein [Hyphococcus sp.]|uniref:hypothetical protein n=1 Tax=Hyphococcus sp. TaxID=2038636 RepID=UPI0037528C59
MFFVKSISLLGAVSLASFSAASAGDINDDLFGAGLLDLEETPMSAAELGAARGGFSFGGMNFNISVDIAPLQISPVLPNGVFGGSGGPLPNGVFNGAGPGNSHNSNAGAGNSNQAQPSANSQATQNAAAPSAVAASNTPTVPAGGAALSDAAAQAASSAAAAPAPADVPASPAPAAAATPVSQVNNNGAIIPSAPPTSSSPEAPQVTSGATNSLAVTELLNDNLSLPGSQPPPPEDAVEIVDGVYFSPSTGETYNPGGLPIDVQVVENGAGQSGNSSQDNPPVSAPPSQTTATNSSTDKAKAPSDDASLSAVLTEMTEPEVIRQSGPDGVTTIVNNALNNVHLTQSVRLNVEVQNYSFVTGLTRATNMTSQAVTQSFFLRGLN